ncbi:MAG: Crp/Fnr family transcriptional regulator [Catalinimonas sp.]
MSPPDLRPFLDPIHPLGGAAYDALRGRLKRVAYERRTFLTRAGETERYLYFVTEGVQRSYYLRGGKEHTIAFTYPLSFSGIPESFLTRQPARYFLETITPSVLWRMSYDDLQRLCDAHPGVERLWRRALEGVLTGVLERQYELLAYTAEEKFRALLTRSPHVLHLIPHKHLASYLGMDPTNFSKLLHRVRVG